jgi:anti-sigma regulatory factor (Ser/Thr protein kinase)
MTEHDHALRHNALVYASPDEYLGRAVPFLREGIAAGEGAIVAQTRLGIAMMREALGEDASKVTFVDVSTSYTRPAHTLAAYHSVYAEQLAKTPTLRAVADVQFGPDPAEWDLWTGYEAVFNRSFGHLPVWVLCSYNANGTPDEIIEGVWQTHPEVVTDTSWGPSAQYQDPAQLLRRLASAPVGLPGLRSIPFGRNPEELREQLARELAAESVGAARTLDLLLAATELAVNANRHGRGIRDVRIGRARGRVVCEIVDMGDGFDDPTAGYLAPRAGTGSGLWVARQLAWEIELFRAADGFTARIWL